MSKCDSNNCSTNGKGDKNRTANFNQFQKNYNKIKWQRPSGKLETKPPQQE